MDDPFDSIGHKNGSLVGAIHEWPLPEASRFGQDPFVVGAIHESFLPLNYQPNRAGEARPVKRIIHT